MEFLASLFRSDFLPHGVCYRWSPGVLWLHVVSDILIALAYYFIPFALIYIIRSRRDLVFPWMFWLFGVFILACGTTHLMSVWVIWNPVYRLDGLVKLITAAASVPTAILLIRLAPAVIALPSPEQLRVANRELEREVAERKAAEAKVRELNALLEKRVEERTGELLTANDRLKQSEMRMHAILDSAPPLVYLKDLHGRYVFVNRAFESTFQVSRDTVNGKTDHDIFALPDADKYREADRLAVTKAAPVEVEEEASHNGEKRTYMSIKFPLFDTSGRPYALCGLSTDITYRKAAQAALQKYNAELEQFAFIAAHDLQEPLRTVKSYAQWLSSRYATSFDEEGREFLGYIVGGVDRMNRLVNDLRSYTEIANRRTTERRLCDLNQTLRMTLENMHASISESKAEITSEDLPTVIANRGQMVQLLQNLLSNAIKYSGPDKPKINVSVTRDDHDWHIRVRDNGIGIDPQYGTQIFGVFKRLHGQEVPGTGVGLAICKQIVEQHGGRIWVESEEGSGATFTFTLPA